MKDIVAKILKFLFTVDKNNHPAPTSTANDIYKSLINRYSINNEETQLWTKGK